MKVRTPRTTDIQSGEPSTHIISTTGELFADGTAIDVIRSESGELALLHWDGKSSRITPQVESATGLYRPAALDPTISRVIRLPRLVAGGGNSKELLEDIAKVFATYLQLPSSLTAAATAFSVASWFSAKRQSAPWLSVTGRHFTVAKPLMRLLACFCRRALLLTDATLSGICSLPLEWGFTFQISQNRASPDLYRLLNAAHERRGCVIRGGRLIHPYAPIVTCTNSPIVPDGLSVAPIEIPAMPSTNLPLLDLEAEERIAAEYQPKLLAYMLENHNHSGNYDADLSTIDVSLRETARMLVACMPLDPGFRAQTIGALKTQHAAMRCDRWTEIEVVLIEAMLFFIHEGGKDAVYVGEVGAAAEKIIAGRGERLKLAAKNVAARLRNLGLKTQEKRDKRGYYYLLTQAFSHRVHELAFILDVPSIQDGQPRCRQCAPSTRGMRNAIDVANVRNAGNEPIQAGEM